MNLPPYAARSTQDAEELVAFIENHVAPLKPSVVLEIGVFNGGSLSAWAHHADDTAFLIGVDDLSQKVRPSVTTKPSQRLALVYGDSRAPATLAQVLDLLEGRQVDFLFVDADHSEECVRNDLRVFLPLVRPGGLVGMHDVIGNSDVNRVWEEYKAEYGGVVEYFNDNAVHRMGIGTFRTHLHATVEDTEGNRENVLMKVPYGIYGSP